MKKKAFEFLKDYSSAIILYSLLAFAIANVVEYRIGMEREYEKAKTEEADTDSVNKEPSCFAILVTR